VNRAWPGVLVITASVAAMAAPSPRQQRFTAGVELVHVPAVVTVKGELLRGLTKNDFQVLEDGVVQNVAFFTEGEAGEQLPMHLGLLLDVSESMGTDLTQAATAAVKFVNAFDEAEDVTFVDFDTEVRVARFSQARYFQLFERIRARKPTGATAIYDAMAMYLRGTMDQPGQKVLLLYSDGDDTTSRLNFGELEKMLKLDNVLVYCIGYLSREGRMHLPQVRLTQMASLTGGKAYFPSDQKEVDKIYTEILAELASRYTLGYVSTNQKQDGAWRKVEVRVTREDAKKAKVRARPGYYAPSPR
jgi:Ca-activated chloride channel family protein